MRGLKKISAIAGMVLLSLGYPTSSSAVEFASAKTYPVGTNPAGVVIADFNGDGKADLAVANNGTVYVNSEDGIVYELPQPPSGTPMGTVITKPGATIFLTSSIGAAYTPLVIGPDGKFYTQNDGHMFVVGD